MNNTVIKEVERELLAAKRAKGSRDGKDAGRKGRKKKLEITPADVPKYYLTISEEDAKRPQKELK